MNYSLIHGVVPNHGVRKRSSPKEHATVGEVSVPKKKK